MRGLAVFALALAACVQAAPHAIVQVPPGDEYAAGAVLVMPTTCVPDGVMPELCSPVTLTAGQPTLTPLPASYAVYVDPTLRLKLEFAGYTLAEGAAMRLETGARTDGQTVYGDGASSSSTAVTTGPTVADLPPGDVRAVARSLGLGGIVTSTFTISPAGFGEIRADLVVTLWDVDSSASRWIVRCGERMYGYRETPLRLANCVDNGVLAALAPGNLIGEAL